MSNTKISRQAVIIDEIKFWKKHNMLPEHYCDYLLTLYTKGEEEPAHSASQRKMNELSMMIVFLAAIISISLFVIYFTELSVVLQTAILTGFVVLLTGMGIYYTKKKVSPVFILISVAFILLLGSIRITDEMSGGSPLMLYTALFLNCILWFVLGLKTKLIYFTLSGVIGSLFLIISILQ
ncbi:hypothetical protein LCM10_07680 [Rossellomorea aquimaris]|uniref:hypothetical protein n=1 Tax=Rossellomorea aquimaris TaxID=189382 RepID=UPI001CD391EA|nr:hypothetical protein [Rossellomorea aquimaris]MCA1054866.1 hypothetical protein [Rossellomorea aquimaris]